MEKKKDAISKLFQRFAIHHCPFSVIYYEFNLSLQNLFLHSLSFSSESTESFSSFFVSEKDVRLFMLCVYSLCLSV